MSQLERLRERFPDAARDIKLNLDAVLKTESLSAPQRWGIAVASGYASRNVELARALLDAARREVEPAVLEDALAAASLMAMNNVYYRFRHLIGKPSYSERPARLRMNRLAKPATNKLDFELFSLAVSAVNACETCLKSHETVVLAGGLTEEQVHDAVRIAAAVQGAAVALEAAELAAEPVTSGDATGAAS